MAYLQIDDRFPDHPKVVGLSDAAFRAHVSALCYCSEHLTDGVFPRTVGDRLAKPRVRKELQAAGLWLDSPGGYAIHDFLDWNASREQVLERRDSRRMAGAKGAASRWGDSKHMAQGVESSGEGSGSEEGGRGGKRRRRHLYTPEFERFWAVYPRREDKGNAADAFDAALERADIEDIIAGAARYAIDPNRDPSKTKFAQGWLNADRWLDETGPGSLSVADQAARIRAVPTDRKEHDG